MSVQGVYTNENNHCAESYCAEIRHSVGGEIQIFLARSWDWECPTHGLVSDRFSDINGMEQEKKRIEVVL